MDGMGWDGVCGAWSVQPRAGTAPCLLCCKRTNGGKEGGQVMDPVVLHFVLLGIEELWDGIMRDQGVSERYRRIPEFHLRYARTILFLPFSSLILSHCLAA